jgi:hypothetical protein
MMKTNYFFALAIMLVIGLQACKKNKAEENKPDGSALYAVSLTAGQSPNQTSYLFGTNGFPDGTLGTSTALESASNATVFKYGKHIYQNNVGAPATLKKFEFDAAGKPKEIGAFAVPGLKTIQSVLFTSETEAYATVAGYGSSPKLVKFNPANMQVTATINLSGLNKTDAVEIYYMGLVQRDSYLFMGVNYQGAGGSNLEDKVFVAVIDRTTNQFVKLIEDSRSSEMWIGGSESGFVPNSLVKDDNGDIYVMGYANNGKPSGILKIKNGTTEFDSSYFFDLNAATGKPCFGILHFGAGQTFTIRYDNEAVYPFDNNNTAGATYYKIDLANQSTAGGISNTVPKFLGNKAFAVKFDDRKIHFNFATSTSNSIYSYDVVDGSVVKAFDLTNPCNGFAKIK